MGGLDLSAHSDAELVEHGRDGRFAAEMQRRLMNEIRLATQQSGAHDEVMIGLTVSLVGLTKWLVRLTWVLGFLALLTIVVTLVA